MLELNDIRDKMNLIDIVFHSAIAQHTLFSAVHGTFSKVDHILEVTKLVLTNMRKLK
jgi:hypothetical protein